MNLWKACKKRLHLDKKRKALKLQDTCESLVANTRAYPPAPVMNSNPVAFESRTDVDEFSGRLGFNAQRGLDTSIGFC